MSSVVCWICGAPADTREHIIKQSEIRRLFGRGSYARGNRLVRIEEGKSRKVIQSENSVHVKYHRSLCRHCNSARSRPWDDAYDLFMNYILAKEDLIRRTRKIRLSDIVPGNGRRIACNLYSYFVKAFGCQLVEHGQYPPNELSEYLLCKKPEMALFLTFAVYASLPNKQDIEMIQVHNLEGDREAGTNRPMNYTWAVSVNWLTFMFWYRISLNEQLGRPWNGTSNQIRMGKYRYLPVS